MSATQVRVVVDFWIEAEDDEHAKDLAEDAVLMAYQHPFVTAYSTETPEVVPCTSV